MPARSGVMGARPPLLQVPHPLVLMKLPIKNSSVSAPCGASSPLSSFHRGFGNAGEFGDASGQMWLLLGVSCPAIRAPCAFPSRSSKRCGDGHFWSVVLIKGLEIVGCVFLKFCVGWVYCNLTLLFLLSNFIALPSVKASLKTQP